MKTTHTIHHLALVGLVAAAMPGIAHAATVQTTSARFEVILPGYTPDKSIEVTHKAYSGILSSAQKSVRFLPSSLPARPEAPESRSKHVGGVSIPDMNCDNAFAEISYSPGGTSNAVLGGGSGETYRACLYAFQKGFKVYGLVTTYQIATDGISASIIGGIGKLVQGDQATNVERVATRLIDKLRERAPDMLVARIEVPGKALQEPDAVAVATLIPPETPAPVAPVQTTAPASVTSQDAQLEARKSLTSMGLAYHDQTQFISAIRRKDDLAVKLFLAGGGVDRNAAGSDGQTPIQVARSTSDPRLIALFETALAPVAPEPPVPAAASMPTNMPPAMQAFQQRLREEMQRQREMYGR